MQTAKHRAVLASAALLAGAFALSTGAAPGGQEEGDEIDRKVDDARTALEEWVENRRLISQEKRDWALGRDLLEDRIDMVQGQIDAVREDIAEAEKEIAENDAESAELEAENAKYVEAADELTATVTELEARIKELVKRLPDPILDRIGLFLKQLPDDPETTEQGLGERYMYVVGILNEIDKFNGEITRTSEVRTLPDGRAIEVTALYAGIGQAWYANAEGTIGGTGTAKPEGWTWTAANESAADIAQAIRIHEGVDQAAFVRLPLRVE